MVISSRSNPLVKKIVALGDKKFRRVCGEYVVEGVKPVAECLKAGMPVTEIICTQSLSEAFSGSTVVSDGIFSHISSEKTPQGVLATVKIPDISVKPPKGRCLLLDRLQDPGNVGTIIRTANAAGFDDIYTVDCADAFSPKAVRASMSGIFFVNIRCGSYEEVFKALDGVPLICADMNGRDVFSYIPPKRFCLAIGNEGNGVGSEVEAFASATVRIPMRATCESLNAAVSAAVAMYALKNNSEVK